MPYAFIAGGSGQIGLATAARLASEGWNVAISSAIAAGKSSASGGFVNLIRTEQLAIAPPPPCLKRILFRLAWTIHETRNPFTEPLFCGGFWEGVQYKLY